MLSSFHGHSLVAHHIIRAGADINYQDEVCSTHAHKSPVMFSYVLCLLILYESILEWLSLAMILAF